MKHWRTHLVIAAAVLAAGSVLSIVLAGPAWTQVRAAFVQDIDNPARQPFQMTLCTSLFGSFGNGCTDTFTVPSNKRLVISYVSGTCTSSLSTMASGLRISTVVDNQPVRHLAHTQLLGATTQARVYDIAQQVTIYADPGTNVSTTIGGFPTSGPSCLFAVSGHHVNF